VSTTIDELLVEGVKQFEDAMIQPLTGIDERRAAPADRIKNLSGGG
jgi:hypothetical protein